MNTTVPEQKTQTPSGAAPTGTGKEDEELREEAIASLKRKRKFARDAVSYVTVNGILWLIWALTDRGGMPPWPAFVTVIWGFVLAIDAWKAFGQWPRSLRRPITDEEIEREKERFRRL